MNIIEFLNYRDECFSCGKKLCTFWSTKGAGSENFTLTSDSISVYSRFVNFTVNLITGEASVPDTITIDAYVLFKSQYIRVSKSCLCGYNYIGTFYFNCKEGSSQISLDKCKIFIEFARTSEYWITSDYSGNKTNITYRKSTDSEHFISLEIPLIYLCDTTIDKLNTKIKTLITFS